MNIWQHLSFDRLFVPALSLSMNNVNHEDAKGVRLIIDWLVFHPEAFIVFWAVVVALIIWLFILLSHERGVKDGNVE